MTGLSERIQRADWKKAKHVPVCTHHEATTSLKINKPGTLYALALCNIHGLWENSKEIGVV